MRKFLLIFMLIQICLLPVYGALRVTTSTKNHSTSHHPFVIFSPPKSGTHLFGKTVSLLINEEPHYYLSTVGNSIPEAINNLVKDEAEGKFSVAHHFSHTMLKVLIQKGYKVIFAVRDPRDQLISVSHWLREGQWSWLKVSTITNFQDQVTELISGAQHGWRCVDSNYLKFEKTLDGLPPGSVLKARFEKLVGPYGGGTVKEQEEEVVKIANFLNFKMNSGDLERVVNNIYGGTATFRDGCIGKWKERFTREQKEEFKSRYNDVLIRLGYEKDANW